MTRGTLQANEYDGEKTESNSCTSPEKPTGTSGPIISIELASTERLVDPDSSSAPLSEGYDNMVCTDEADIVLGLMDLISETLDKNDPQNCDCNGSLFSKQVVGSSIYPGADDCLTSTVQETSREYHDDTHVARDVGQPMVENIQDCDPNGGSVLHKTKGVCVTGISLMDTSENNDACSAIDTLCMDEGAVHTLCVAQGDGKIAVEEGKRENLPVVSDTHDSMAISSQIIHQMPDEQAISFPQDAQVVVKLRKELSEHLFSAEELDSGDQFRSESLDSAILIVMSDLPKEESHDHKILEKVDDVDGNQATLGEGLHQANDIEAAFSREKTAVLVREDYQLAVKTIKEATSDPYYFSDRDEQTADADSKLVTKRECSSQAIEVEAKTHKGGKVGSPSDHNQVMDLDGRIQLSNVETTSGSSQVAEVQGTSYEEDKDANPANCIGELNAGDAENVSGSGQNAKVEGTSCDRNKGTCPINGGNQLNAGDCVQLPYADSPSGIQVSMRRGGTSQAADEVDFSECLKVTSLKIDGQFAVGSTTETTELYAGTLSSGQADWQSADVAVSTRVTRFERSQQDIVEEATNLADEGEFAVQNPPEIFQFYFRRRKKSSQDHTVFPYCTSLAGSVVTGQNLAGKIASEPDTGLKFYTRRSCLTALQSLADAATMTEGHSQNSGPHTASTGKGQKGTPFPLQSQKQLNTPTKAISQAKNESVHNDPMMPMRKSSGVAVQQNNRKGQGSSKIGRNFETLNSTTQSIELPDWLPKGWTAEVKVREGGHTAGTKDKYYHDPVSGHRFRSKNEVMEYLERGTLERWRLKPKSNSKLSGQNTTAKVHSHSAPGKLSNQQILESPSSNHLTAQMNTTPVTANPIQPSLAAHFDAPSSRPGSNVLPPPVTWAPVFGPTGPIWLPWGGPISQIQEAGRAGTALMDTGGMSVARVSSSSKVVIAPSSKDQELKDTESRGKLIFRLKRKHPEQEPGKGKPKRPIYEVVGRENGSSSTSTQICEEKKSVIPNASAQENVVTSAPTPVQGEKSSLIKEPLGKSSTQDYLSKMLTEESLFKKLTEPSIRMAKHQLPLLPKWSGEQDTAWTALGIPATAGASGLQRMRQFHAHPLFLQPLETSTQSQWQYPVPSHIPTFAPTPTSMPYPAHMSLPVSAPIPAAPNCLTVPFSSSVYDRVPPSDSCNWITAGKLETEFVGAAAILDKEYLAHWTAVQKPLTKVATMKQLEGLGRHICQQGLQSVQQPKNMEFCLEHISASLKGPNMHSGTQRHSSSLVVEGLWETPQAA